MNDYKKTAPDDSGVKGGMEENENAAALQISTQKHTTTGPEVQGIADILPHGAEHAVSSAEVMRLCGISSIRQLRAAIAEERAAGALILSNTTGGYYLPAEGEQGREEMQHFVNTVRSKALALLCAARPARAALRIMAGQESLQEETGTEDVVNG